MSDGSGAGRQMAWWHRSCAIRWLRALRNAAREFRGDILGGPDVDWARCQARRSTGPILVLMKPARAASRRFLPGSPFNVPPVDPLVEQFAIRDRVTHDKYGLGRVVLVEDDDAVIVVFGSRKVRILSPFTRLTKL